MSDIIIIGGGSSIKSLIARDLWNKIKNNITIGLNFSFRDFMPTIVCCCDYKFYVGKVGIQERKDPNTGEIYLDKTVFDPEFRSELTAVPLIVAPARNEMINDKLPNGEAVNKENTIFLPYYTEDIQLCGIWGLNVACKLYPDRIFLLGFDYGDIGQGTHYYTHTNHRGIGLTKVYDDKKLEYFESFIDSGIKIYNVSLDSNLKCFPKISGVTFFNMIKNNQIWNQDELRKYIRTIIKR